MTTPATDYIITSHISDGSHGGIIMKCIHKKTGKLYVRKTIPTESFERGENEIMALSDLIHPHIISLEDSYMDDDGYHMILEYGQHDLWYEISKNRFLSSEETMHYTKEILLALKYIHSQGYTHRDIKPENCILVNGVLKLCDFDTCIDEEKFTGNYSTGTPAFLAPEIMHRQSDCTNKVDIWALGVSMYEMSQGHLPYKLAPGRRVLDIEDFNEELHFRSDTDSSLKSLILELLTIDPKKRPSAAELLARNFS